MFKQTASLINGLFTVSSNSFSIYSPEYQLKCYLANVTSVLDTVLDVERRGVMRKIRGCARARLLAASAELCSSDKGTDVKRRAARAFPIMRLMHARALFTPGMENNLARICTLARGLISVVTIQTETNTQRHVS